MARAYERGPAGRAAPAAAVPNIAASIMVCVDSNTTWLPMARADVAATEHQLALGRSVQRWVSFAHGSLVIVVAAAAPGQGKPAVIGEAHQRAIAAAAAATSAERDVATAATAIADARKAAAFARPAGRSW